MLPPLNPWLKNNIIPFKTILLGVLLSAIMLQSQVFAHEDRAFITPEQAVAQYGHTIEELMQKTGCPSCGGDRSSSSQKPSCERRHLSKHASSDPAQTSSSLLVFVSFSMPDHALKSLFQSAQKVGGQLLLRGLLNNSWKQTAHKLRALNLTVSIDPEAFKAFDVKAVPQFVLRTEEVQDPSLTLKGNVSLKFALEKFAQEGSPQALQLLSKLRGQP